MTKIFLSLTLALVLLAGCGAPSPKLAGNLSMTVKDYQQAADYYEKALKDDPDSVMLLTNLGRAYYNLGEYDKAETNFKGATQVQNGYPTADFYLGLCAIAKGDRQAGFDIFDKFRYIGKSHVTKSVRSMSKQLTDNTDDSNDYLIQKMFQAWNDGMQAEHQAETGRN
ncbi:MAG: tetratricopeptide repeat protein [Pseudodesulfovibrio sp.]|nr:tetratricopeptide repeat protein [Pseudodesulfovibrio sp.]